MADNQVDGWRLPGQLLQKRIKNKWIVFSNAYLELLTVSRNSYDVFSLLTLCVARFHGFALAAVRKEIPLDDDHGSRRCGSC